MWVAPGLLGACAALASAASVWGETGAGASGLPGVAGVFTGGFPKLFVVIGGIVVAAPPGCSPPCGLNRDLLPATALGAVTGAGRAIVQPRRPPGAARPP
ncbi:hypothetical protein MyNCGM152_29180 [Achromobacter xylosoxidans]